MIHSWHVPNADVWESGTPSPMGDRDIPDGSIVFEVKDPAHVCKVLGDFVHECRSNWGDHKFCGCFDGVPYSVALTGDMIVFKFDCESG